MPTCLVNKCMSKTGRKGQSQDIRLHKFPRDPFRIRQWLLQTGQNFNNLEALVERIREGQLRNRYWLCSLHFTIDAYFPYASGRVLREDAVPLIFPQVGPGESVIQETLIKTRHRGKKRDLEALQATSIPSEDLESYGIYAVLVKEEPDITPELEIEICKPGHCTVGTQTGFTLSNSVLKSVDEEESPYVDTLLSETSSLGFGGPLLSTPNTQPGKITLLEAEDFESPLGKRPHIKTVLVRETTHDVSDKFTGFSPICVKTEPPDFEEVSKETSDLSANPWMQKGQLKEHVEEEQTTSDEGIVQDRKLSIFESSLDGLFRKITCLSPDDCNSKINSVIKTFDGPSCIITGTCFKGHKFVLLETPKFKI